jgi:hypothetical protein
MGHQLLPVAKDALGFGPKPVPGTATAGGPGVGQPGGGGYPSQPGNMQVAQQQPMYAPQGPSFHYEQDPGSILSHRPGTVGNLAAPNMSSSLKFGSTKTADLITRILTNRAANGLIDGTLTPQTTRPQPPTNPKEVELLTAHPEIAEMLKDEKTKAYLERLIS